MNLAEKDRLNTLRKVYQEKDLYSDMPEISRFLGIVIAMFYNDHESPHFHAFYNEFTLRVHVETGEILSGQAPNRIKKYIEEWRSLHQEELMDNWKSVLKGIPPNKISPLV